LEPIVWLAVQAARKMSALEYSAALAAQSATSRALGAFFETCDVLLTPTVARPTPEVGSKLNLLQTDVALDAWFQPVVEAVPYTPLCNFTGVPAISLPLGELRGEAGPMPLGMHFMAPMGEDARLLRLAAQLEAVATRQLKGGGAIPRVHVTGLRG
jgi:amidase